MGSRPQVGVPRDRLAPHAIARWARRHPDRIAVAEVDGLALTYRQLDERCRHFAEAFRRLGVKPGDHVATLLPNGHLAHHTWLGLAWLRAVEVPLNPASTGDLLHDALARSDAVGLVVDGALAGRLRSLAPLPELRWAIVAGEAPPDIGGQHAELRLLHDLLDGVPPVTDLDGPEYRDPAGLLFTSGTTGPSKAVVVPWATTYHFWSWVPEDTIGEGEAVYCPLPVAHNSGRSCLNYAMARGGTFVFRERFSGTAFWGDVRRYGCRAAAIVGPMTALLQAQPQRPDDADNPLRGVLCGPMIPDIAAFERRFGVRVATCYGMTETGIVLSTGWDHGPWQSCGRARPDYPWPEVRVVDPNDEPVGPGEVGELVVRTAEPWALNAGYYGDPAATASAWRNGWFHTGDAFRYDDDGTYYLVDRLKDAIRRRGENISSFEVESVVAGHPAVDDVAVVAVPGEFGDDEVMAVVESRDPAAVDPSELHDWLAERLPRFMVPRFIEVTDGLPRNATTQRVRKLELRERGITPSTWDRDRRLGSHPPPPT